MGVWESTRKKLEQKAPDMTSITNAINKMDNAVREYMPDSEAQDKMARVLTNLGFYAADAAVSDSLKSVTGGVKLSRIVQEGLRDQSSPECIQDRSKFKRQEEEVKKMQEKIEKMQEEMNKANCQNEQLLERMNKVVSQKLVSKL